jgi:hypothetical protein
LRMALQNRKVMLVWGYGYEVTTTMGSLSSIDMPPTRIPYTRFLGISGHNLTILIRHKSQNFLFDHACHVDLHLRPIDRNGTVHLRHEYAPMK